MGSQGCQQSSEDLPVGSGGSIQGFRSLFRVHRGQRTVCRSPENGCGGLDRALLSKNQTSGASAEGREGIPSGSDHSCVASNDMGTYPRRQGLWPRNPEASPPRARRSPQQAASSLPIPSPRVPRTGECVSQVGVRVRTPGASGRNAIPKGRNPPPKVPTAILWARKPGFSPPEAFRSPRNPRPWGSIGARARHLDCGDRSRRFD
ncbi:MAG: hypothetical protein QOJ98_427 [Acidobacteriota bacterium]|jgi:hypothetical protein|nr:hypothetical protein [Acidobacteriota bacterium]